MSSIEIAVPDIGDFHEVPVIEVLVKPGDAVQPEDPLVTLESDKATMDIPSPIAGTVTAVNVRIGDKVSEGSRIVMLDTLGTPAAAPGVTQRHVAPAARPDAPAPAILPVAPGTSLEAAMRPPRGEKGRADSPGEGANPTPPSGPTVEVRVPDIGDFSDVPVIELLVKAGDIVKADDALVTLESDKATMDVPAPFGGVVEALRVQPGDKVSEGSVLLTMRTVDQHPIGSAAADRADDAGTATRSGAAAPLAPDNAMPASQTRGSDARTENPADPRTSLQQPSAARDADRAAGAADSVNEHGFRAAHASPSVRKFARELGVDLAQVQGTGPKQRILHEDVQGYVKQALTGAGAARTPSPASPASPGQLNLLPWPQVDFGKYGPVEEKDLSRIRKLSGANLARNWVLIPHVTQFDEADITELEALRVRLNKENEKAGIKLTMLAFLIKASVAALQRFPDFNTSLRGTSEGDKLVYKRYYNIGFAADTPNGLVVPVIRNADAMTVSEIAQAMAELSKKARDGKLTAAEMQGGCFSISSLGGIGGTAFTPIINAPEVAILGVSRSSMKPVWDGSTFVPRLLLPLSLSYDHRVIDGAAAARFTNYFATLLADLRRSLL